MLIKVNCARRKLQGSFFYIMYSYVVLGNNLENTNAAINSDVATKPDVSNTLCIEI